MPIAANREIQRERSVQGAAWDRVHLGYFCDPEAAAPLVEAILKRAARIHPNTVADLGGGTGFILSELERRGIEATAELVNLEISPAQLAAGRRGRVRSVAGSAAEFRREDILSDAGTILFIMRSVLHYLGPEGLLPTLRHIRSRMRRGEYFIHQTACFDEFRAAAGINALYAALGTQKRYPLVPDLAGSLAQAGFDPGVPRPAPSLALTSEALAGRYGITPAGMAQIGRRLKASFGDLPGVFAAGEIGLIAFLPYRIFESCAV